MSETKPKPVQFSDRVATVGRTLLYTYTGEEHEHMKPDTAGQQRPAVVVRTWGTSPGSAVNVQVMTDGCGDVDGGGPGADGSLRLTSLLIAAEPTPGFLHWPELAAPVKTSELAEAVEKDSEPASAGDAPEATAKPAKAPRARKR